MRRFTRRSAGADVSLVFYVGLGKAIQGRATCSRTPSGQRSLGPIGHLRRIPARGATARIAATEPTGSGVQDHRSPPRRSTARFGSRSAAPLWTSGTSGADRGDPGRLAADWRRGRSRGPAAVVTWVRRGCWGAYLPAASPHHRETDVRFSIHRRLYIVRGDAGGVPIGRSGPGRLPSSELEAGEWEVFGCAPGRRIRTGSRRGAMRRPWAGSMDTGLRTDRSPDPGE